MSYKKIFIDCSNLRVGGGIQVALSFLYDLSAMEIENTFTVVLSPEIGKLLEKDKFEKHFSFFQMQRKNYSNILARRKAVKVIEDNEKPNVIFTLFGPSYHKSNAPKIVGYAIPHYIYENSPFFKMISLKEKLRLFMMKKIQIQMFKKNSDKLIFETSDAQQLFCMKYKFNIENTFVIPNSLNQVFLKPLLWESLPFKLDPTYRILCLSANYKHKNLAIIPKVIDSLIGDYGIENFRFIISQNQDQLNFENKYDNYIDCVGNVPLEQVPSLYKSVDLLFMPTLLEVFSTTYLEAMFMKVPIVTSNLSFAKDVCRDAALYFNPMDAKNAAEMITTMIKNGNVRKEKIGSGLRNLKRFNTSKERTNEYLEVIKKTIENDICW
jgi:glycosyltransferase involved in cell wall biosynthesis